MWKLRTGRRGSVALVAFDRGVLVACRAVLVGLVVLGGLLILLARATLPPSSLRSCAELDVCVATTPDVSEASLADAMSR